MSKKIDRYHVEHGSVFEYSQERRAYVYLTNTWTLRHYAGLKRVTGKNIAAAVAMWEDALLMQEDGECRR